MNYLSALYYTGLDIGSREDVLLKPQPLQLKGKQRQQFGRAPLPSDISMKAYGNYLCLLCIYRQPPISLMTLGVPFA
jgi:hypothetical protein